MIRTIQGLLKQPASLQAPAFSRMARPLLCAILAQLASPVGASALTFGSNIHTGGGSTGANQSVADILNSRNLKNARMDFFVGNDQTLVRDQIQKIRANGGSAEVSIQISYQWDHSCNQDLASVEQDAYNQTSTGVNQMKDLVHDFELLNEVTLRSELLPEVGNNTAGSSTQPYAGKACYKTITAVLRGMSRAVHDIGASSGLPLRVILGAVGRDFGFLSYMQQQGVVFDVVGYHIYPHQYDTSLLSDSWFGAGGPLAQLAVFNKPVHINEFNCGEIYDSSYDNQKGSSPTETCLQSYKKHLSDLVSQTQINLESIHLYELTDETSVSGIEGRFGLMYNLSAPKVHLYVASAFAGGNLTSSEQAEVTNRGILTDAQIAAFKPSAGNSSGPAAAPAPAPAPAASSAPAPAPAAASGDIVVTIKTAAGLCLDAYQWSTKLASPIVQYACNGNQNQQFKVAVNSDGSYSLSNSYSKLCMDIAGVSQKDGANLIQYTCKGSSNQKFKAVSQGNGMVTLVASHSGKCLYSPGTDSSLQLKQSTCNGADSQLFSLSVLSGSLP